MNICLWEYHFQEIINGEDLKLEKDSLNFIEVKNSIQRLKVIKNGEKLREYE